MMHDRRLVTEYTHLVYLQTFTHVTRWTHSGCYNSLLVYMIIHLQVVHLMN